MEQTFSITVKETAIEDINGGVYRRLDIVHGGGTSFLKDGGEKKDAYSSQFLGAAVRKVVYKLLKQYNLGTDDIKTLCSGEKDKEKIVFYKSVQPEPGTEDQYKAIPNSVSGETHYYNAPKTPILQQIVDEAGREWKASDGTTLAIDNNINNNVKIANLARICQLAIPTEEQADCSILIDADKPIQIKEVEGRGRKGKEGREMDIEFGNRRQVIFTGAPGTGKTYSIREYVKKKCGEPNSHDPDFPDLQQSMFVQFHSSYDYSDFVEGLRPVQLKIKGQGAEQDRYEVAFVRVDGIFKRFCRQIVEYNLKVLKKEGLLSDDKIALLRKACDLPANASDEAKKDREAIRAKIMETKFYFVIDEINRADLGRVFGELMFGLEESYRGVENSFPTQYANLTTYNVDQEHPEENGYYGRTEDGCIGREDVFEQGFFIPENLYIIGSMNDIDRSVESIDFALRRRFKWIEVKANEKMSEVLSSINEKEKRMGPDELGDLVSRAVALNNVISGSVSENGGAQFGLNEAFHIGPAYFKDYDPKNPDETWETSIEPILKEYVRGRNPDKVEKFLAACKDAFLNSKAGGAKGRRGRAGKNTTADAGPSASGEVSTSAETSASPDAGAAGEQA